MMGVRFSWEKSSAVALPVREKPKAFEGVKIYMFHRNFLNLSEEESLLRRLVSGGRRGLQRSMRHWNYSVTD